MKATSRVLVLSLSVVLASLTVGCASGAQSAASSPPRPSRSTAVSSPTAASSHIYLAQATCWNTLSCCIQRFPLTAVQHCGASAAEIAEVLHGAKLLHETTQDAAVKLKEEAQEQADARAAETTGAEEEASPEPCDCQGQNHHVISRPIAEALKRHKTLKGLYEPRDERFVAKAKDKESHCGYQRWHRDVDAEVVRWLRDVPAATREEFEKLLHAIYSRPEMLRRFPHGF